MKKVRALLCENLHEHLNFHIWMSFLLGCICLSFFINTILLRGKGGEIGHRIYVFALITLFFSCH